MTTLDTTGSSETSQPALYIQKEDHDTEPIEEPLLISDVRPTEAYTPEPTQIVTGKKMTTAALNFAEIPLPELNRNWVEPEAMWTSISPSKGQDMINKGKGIRLTPTEQKENQRRRARREQNTLPCRC